MPLRNPKQFPECYLNSFGNLQNFDSRKAKIAMHIQCRAENETNSATLLVPYCPLINHIT